MKLEIQMVMIYLNMRVIDIRSYNQQKAEWIKRRWMRNVSIRIVKAMRYVFVFFRNAISLRYIELDINSFI